MAVGSIFSPNLPVSVSRTATGGGGIGVLGKPLATFLGTSSAGGFNFPAITPNSDPYSTAWDTRAANAGNAQKSLVDFTNDYLASRPTMKSFADSETNAIGKFYGSGPGSATYDLNQIAGQRSKAINDAAQSAINRAARSNSVRRMNSGNNSATDRSYAQILANIAAQSAMDRTASNASDYKYVADNQRALTGVRQNILNNLMSSQFAPTDLANKYEATNLNDLGTLGSLDDSEIRRQTLLNSLIA